MEVTIDPKSVQDVFRNYRLFNKNIQRNLENTVNDSAKAIKRGAKQRVPSRGVRKNAGGRKLDLKSRITLSRAKFKKDKTAAKVISGAPHSHLVEYGTAPHFLDKGIKRKKPMVIDGQPVVGKIRHPGSKKRPFMIPAYMAERNKFLRSVEKVIRQETERADK